MQNMYKQLGDYKMTSAIKMKEKQTVYTYKT